MAKKKATVLTEAGTVFLAKRVQLGMSAKELSEKSGVSRPTINKIEACATGIVDINPSVKVLESLAKALDLTIQVSFVHT